MQFRVYAPFKRRLRLNNGHVAWGLEFRGSGEQKEKNNGVWFLLVLRAYRD